jgi:hypothetical protein
MQQDPTEWLALKEQAQLDTVPAMDPRRTRARETNGSGIRSSRIGGSTFMNFQAYNGGGRRSWSETRKRRNIPLFMV